ncbi:restriction endonuclease subunit S [Vallitalea maricola]|uniref:Uncharacterized protein n=1 Tax=Vallitalea maricola TaxID=3074433 RepID=A0ACB5UKT7_9FIRM|nr:hypothetical protein AN2V17_27130 [Vallitalea sp. AN17-2]
MADKNRKPEIRFEGFYDDWEECKVEKLCSISTGKSNTQDNVSDGKYRFYVRSPIIEHSNRYIYDQEAVLTVGDGVGTGKVFHYVNGKYDLHQRVYQMYDFNGVLGKYFYYNFSLNFYERVMSMTAKTSVDSVRLEMISKMDMCFPEIEEQKRIISLLENLDKIITLHQRKHKKILSIKKAMLNKMFPEKNNDIPEIRFKGHTDVWEQREFGKCVLIQRGGSPRPIEDFIINDVNGINWIKIGDVAKGSRYITSTKEKIKLEGEKKSRRVFIGDLILSNSMSFGRPYIMQVDGCIHDGWLLIRDKKKMFDIEYLLQMLSSDYMLDQYKSLASGGVVNNLNSELVQSTTVLLPEITEQEKIGELFKQIDNLITLHENQLDKLKNIKESCLEKMFV